MNNKRRIVKVTKQDFIVERRPPNKPTRCSIPQPLSVSTLVVLLGTTSISAFAGFDIPTGAPLSPLFGAQPFEQQMLRFEEFGPQPLPNNAPSALLPVPNNCDSSPADAALDSFLKAPRGILYAA